MFGPVPAGLAQQLAQGDAHRCSAAYGSAAFTSRPHHRTRPQLDYPTNARSRPEALRTRRRRTPVRWQGTHGAQHPRMLRRARANGGLRAVEDHPPGRGDETTRHHRGLRTRPGSHRIRRREPRAAHRAAREPRSQAHGRGRVERPAVREQHRRTRRERHHIRGHAGSHHRCAAEPLVRPPRRPPRRRHRHGRGHPPYLVVSRLRHRGSRPYPG